MTAKTNTVAARDVAADLIGDSPVRKSKPAKGKKVVKAKKAAAPKAASKKTAAVRSLSKPAADKVAKPGRVGRFAVDKKIKVLKERENDDNSTIATIWKMVKTSKTVGDFDKARRNPKVKIDNLAGIANRYLLTFVREKFVSIAA